MVPMGRSGTLESSITLVAEPFCPGFVELAVLHQLQASGYQVHSSYAEVRLRDRPAPVPGSPTQVVAKQRWTTPYHCRLIARADEVGQGILWYTIQVVESRTGRVLRSTAKPAGGVMAWTEFQRNLVAFLN